jgi:poly(A) polymerase/tRNA nucleotidyltransferase (CCA-adding enzyme)
MNPIIPQNIIYVTNLLKRAGFEAFLVGGCVRDLLMKQIKNVSREPKDWDITTDADPEQILSVFEQNNIKTVYENQFGTVSVIFEDEPLNSSVREIQITPYRTDGNYNDNRHPDSVSFTKNILDDLSRRDFTMNAIAMHPETFEIIDPFHGKQSIENGVITSVGNPTERFSEDALRIMRAIRFSAQLNIPVSHETLLAIGETKDLLKNISIERIRDEFIKMIDSDNPTIGMFLMKQLGILEIILPEFIPGIGCEQGGVHKYDVFDHLMYALQHAADKQYSFHVKLSALFHDIGKPKTRRPGHKKAYTFYGHEVVGARMTEKIMDRMKFPKNDIDIVVKFVRWHMFFSDTEQITLTAVRRMIQNVGKDSIWELMKVRECDRAGMKKSEAPERLRKYFAMIEECLRDPISVAQLQIDGNYLMNTLHMKPGPRMGWMLHALLEEVLEDPTKNTIAILSERIKDLDELDNTALQKLGEQGKQQKETLDQQEIDKLHVKHRVFKKE